MISPSVESLIYLVPLLSVIITNKRVSDTRSSNRTNRAVSVLGVHDMLRTVQLFSHKEMKPDSLDGSIRYNIV